MGKAGGDGAVGQLAEQPQLAIGFDPVLIVNGCVFTIYWCESATKLGW